MDRHKRIISDNTLNAKIAICYSTVKELLSQKNIFSTKPLTTRAEPVMRGKVLAQMNGQEHKFKRSLITKKITGNILVSYYKQYLHDLCDELIHQLQLKNEFDFIVDFGKKYSMLSTFKILGVNQKELEFYHQRLRLIVKFITGFNISEEEKSTYIKAAIEMEHDILKLLEEKRKNPGNDLISYMLSVDYENNKLNNNEIVALTLNVLLAASEPVDKVLSICIYHLYRNQDYLQQVISGKIKTNDILQEALRITPPVHLIPRLAMDNYTTYH